MPAAASTVARARRVARRERARDRERARALVGARAARCATRARGRRRRARSGRRGSRARDRGRGRPASRPRPAARPCGRSTRRCGPDDREQLHADGRDAAEVAGPVLALEPLGGAAPARPRSRSRAGRARRPTARRARRRRASAATRSSRVEVARVRVEVRPVRELRGVDEEARDDDVALGARRAEERDVTGVERAHRRHEADGRARHGAARAPCRSSRIVRRRLHRRGSSSCADTGQPAA